MDYRNRHMRRAGEYAFAGPASYRPTAEKTEWAAITQRVDNQIVPDAAERRELDYQELKARWIARKLSVYGGWMLPLWWTAQYRGKRGPLRVCLERPLFETLMTCGAWLWFLPLPVIKLKCDPFTGLYHQIVQGQPEAVSC